MSVPATLSPLPTSASRGPLGNWWPERERLQQPFRIERRRGDRWPLHGVATLLSLGVDLGILVELDTLGCSPWWLAGRSITPIAVGTRVSVGFSDQRCRPGIAHVQRCERASDGRYRIALRFDGTALC